MCPFQSVVCRECGLAVWIQLFSSMHPYVSKNLLLQMFCNRRFFDALLVVLRGSVRNYKAFSCVHIISHATLCMDLYSRTDCAQFAAYQG